MAEREDRTPEAPDRSPEVDARTSRSAAAARIAQQHTWVDLQVRQAVERGEFDDLPGAGKPIADLGTEHDPDWWVKKLVEREKISVLPPALAIRKDDAELDARLDKLASEHLVRQEVEEFNARVRKALYGQPTGGPPMITRQRDVDAEVVAWRERRTARVEAQRAALAAARQQQRDAPPRRRRWFRRL